MGSVSSHFVGGGGGLLMSLIAFSIVFLVIIGLMLLMMGLKNFVGMVNPEAGALKKNMPVPVEEHKAALSEAASVTTDAGAPFVNDELAAVITAAIIAATGVAARVLSFAPSRPDEIRAGHGMPVWKTTGILSNNRGLRD